MTEWRKLRDAGVQVGEAVGKLTAEQAEIARLRRQLEVSEGQLKQRKAALGIMEELSAFFENTMEESQVEPNPKKK